MNAQWYVWLPGGKEIRVDADAAAVREGALVLSRRDEDGHTWVTMKLAPGEWTSVIAEITSRGENELVAETVA